MKTCILYSLCSLNTYNNMRNTESLITLDIFISTFLTFNFKRSVYNTNSYRNARMLKKTMYFIVCFEIV